MLLPLRTIHLSGGIEGKAGVQKNPKQLFLDISSMSPVSSSLPTLVCTDLRKQVNGEEGTGLQIQRDRGVISSHAEYQLWGVFVISLGYGVFSGKIGSANDDYMTCNHVCQVPRIRGFPGAAVVKKNLPANKRHRFDPWVRKIPWRRKWQPTPVFLPGKSHGQRSLAGYTVHGVTKNQTQLSEHKQAPRIWKTKQFWVLFLLEFFMPQKSPLSISLCLCLQIRGSKKSCALYHISCLSIPLLPGLGDSSSKDKTDWALARQLVTTHFHFPWKEELVSFMLADFWVKWN